MIDIGTDHRLVNANLRISLRANKQAFDVRCQSYWAKLSQPLQSTSSEHSTSNSVTDLTRLWTEQPYQTTP